MSVRRRTVRTASASRPTQTAAQLTTQLSLTVGPFAFAAFVGWLLASGGLNDGLRFAVTGAGLALYAVPWFLADARAGGSVVFDWGRDQITWSDGSGRTREAAPLAEVSHVRCAWYPVRRRVVSFELRGRRLRARMHPRAAEQLARRLSESTAMAPSTDTDAG